MNKYFALLVSSLLVALAGGCGEEEASLNSKPYPNLEISFIDSQGRDLVEGIPTIELNTDEALYGDGFLSSNTYDVKLFINDKEVAPLPSIRRFRMNVIYKDEFAPYDAIFFYIDDLIHLSGKSIHMVRCEMVCPYIFGDDRTHTLVGELHRGSMFLKCWFDGVEASPAYHVVEGERRYIEFGSFIVQVDRL
jgi:hypothetical protein